MSSISVIGLLPIFRACYDASPLPHAFKELCNEACNGASEKLLVDKNNDDFFEPRRLLERRFFARGVSAYKGENSNSHSNRDPSYQKLALSTRT